MPDRTLDRYLKVFKYFPDFCWQSHTTSKYDLFAVHVDHRKSEVIQTCDYENVVVLLCVSLREDVFQDSPLLLFVAHSSRDLLQPDKALQDGLVVIVVLRYLD